MSSTEAEIIAAESGVGEETARRLAKLAGRIRKLVDRGLEEGVSTRLLANAGRLIAAGLAPMDACDAAFSQTLTDDPDLRQSIRQLSMDFF